MFSERNSEALNAPGNAEYVSMNQDYYGTWVGEAAAAPSLAAAPGTAH